MPNRVDRFQKGDIIVLVLRVVRDKVIHARRSQQPLLVSRDLE
jgi:hypothetical protein